MVNLPPGVKVTAGYSDHDTKTQVEEVVQGVEMDEAEQVTVAALSGYQEPDGP